MALSYRHLLMLALLPVAAYLLIFHPATLDPTNCGWLIRGTDNGENALGLHAFLHDRASGWWPRTTLLNYPDGVPLLFTDSNPLLAFLAKPLEPLLPANFQLVGPWVLLCFGLQAGFATLLLRRHAPSFMALWCGVALFLLMPTLANRFMHVNLMAHWLILWSLWLFLNVRRAGDMRWWAAVMLTAAMVHNYLLLMIAAIWASAMLERFVAGDTRRRMALTGGSIAILAVVALLLRAHGAGGAFEVTHSYGAFAMSLDALWNPANPSFSSLLPSVEQRQGRDFEGFQYLGAGLLLLLPVAFVSRVVGGPVRSDLRRLIWLVPALMVLTMLSISPFVDFAGVPVLRLPVPAAFDRILDTVRASGRLFWPAAYVLVLLGIRFAFRLRLGVAQPLLMFALAIQLWDLNGMHRSIRALSAEAADGKLYVRTPSPEWDRAIATAHDVTFEPADTLADLAVFQEIAWRAASMGKPIRHVYAARNNVATETRLKAENRAYMQRKLADDRLYLLLTGVPVPDDARHRLTVIDGIRVILPAQPIARQSPS